MLSRESPAGLARADNNLARIRKTRTARRRIETLAHVPARNIPRTARSRHPFADKHAPTSMLRRMRGPDLNQGGPFADPGHAPPAVVSTGFQMGTPSPCPPAGRRGARVSWSRL
jgi:hypothetical protein